MPRGPIGVGLIGLGIVGSGVARAPLERGDHFSRQVGALLPLDEPLARLDGVYSAVQLVGDLTGTVTFQGRGAGVEPTRSAVVADLLDLAHSIVLGTREHRYWGPEGDVAILGLDEWETRYYLRVTVSDRPGVLAALATVLGAQDVSIAAVNQKEANANERTAELVIKTHRASERAVQAALREVGALPVVASVNSFLRVEG